MMKYSILILFVVMTYNLVGQVNLGYQTPHDDILKLADASPAPMMRIDSKAEKALLLKRNMYKTIEEVSMKEMRLGGLRIDPRTSLSSRTNFAIGITLLDVATGVESSITSLPTSGLYSKMAWSHDQSMAAILNTTNEGVDLWVIDVNKGSAQKVAGPNIHGSLGTTMAWMKDDKSILIKMKPDGTQPIVDRTQIIPSGPTISENDGQKAQNRTYQDLLKNPIDEENFKKLTTSEIWKVNLDGSKSLFLKADMYDDMDFSPDGNHIMIATIKKPFSYLVPYYRFPYEYNIYDTNARLVKKVFDIPLIEEMPSGFMAVSTFPRRINWRSDKGSTLYWVEALDEGNPDKDVTFRDAVYQLEAPFNKSKSLLVSTKERFSNIMWCNDDIAILSEYWWNTRNARTLHFNPSDSNSKPQLINERNYQDTYSNPGSFVTEKNDFGARVLAMSGDNLYLLGDGYSDNGKHPFVDQYNVKSGVTTRLFQTTADDKLEDFATAVDIGKGLILSRIESKSEYPNYYLRNIKTNELKPITKFDNPFAVLNDVHKEVISYKRDDGLELSGTLYLPVGYDKTKKEKMPMIMWAYPREYKDKASAGQTTNNPNEFTFPYYGSPIYWVNRGYVVLDDAAFPIVGEGETEPNDAFIKQLVANAKAAIDAVDDLGYIDHNKVAVGGHSYGAFMTANLLSHSDLFAAGIARSGAYNRTLTPFGFQSEERTYWEAPEVYNTMSPFMNAHKMKTPLLLIHGEADNNSGTYPMQSERYFNALKGLGATVRLVMLPNESHGYAARESIMHLLWEQDTWLEKYVKNKEVDQTPKP